MTSLEHYSLMVLFISCSILTFESVAKSYSLAIQMKSLQHHFCLCIDAIQGLMSWPVAISSITRNKSFKKIIA